MSSQPAAKLSAKPSFKPAAPCIADVQGAADARNIAIDQVGIKDLRYPLTVADRSGPQHTVARVNMYVQLPPHCKGTHMSRFVEVLHNHREALSAASIGPLLAELQARLDAPAGRVELTFPYFVGKRAPASGAHSLLDYRVTLSGDIGDGGRQRAAMGVVIPVTSLCPCSKAISEYGAHNQRSHISVEVRPARALFIEELIDLVEGQASSQLYGLLKRPDEKFVTEQAYDNPKFVEDVVRDVAVTFDRDSRITAYSVSVENFESIHNHSAYARIARDKTGA